MPSVSAELPDIEQTVVRPTVYQVIEQVKDILNIPGNPEVFFAGPRGTVSAAGSHTEENGLAKEARFDNLNGLFIEVNEEYDQSAVQEVHTHDWDNVPFFVDTSTGVSARPIYLPSKIEISFRFRHNSESEVRQWIARIMKQCGRGRDTHLHRIEYHYPISHAFMYLLEDIHTLREAKEGYQEDFKAYFERYRSSRITVLSNQSGSQRHLAIKESQGMIVGSFDFVVTPEKPVFNKEQGYWETNFSYAYQYSRPDSIFIHYPISVHNQYMPEIYRKHLDDEPDPKKTRHYFSYSMEALEFFSTDHHDHALRDSPFIQIPSYDDFKPTFPQFTATVLLGLAFLEDDKRTLINLTELGDWELDKDIIAFLKMEIPYLKELHKSVFHVSIYENNEVVSPDRFEITPDLTIRFLEDASYRPVYHVRLSVMPEIHRPSFMSWKRLSRYPGGFIKLVMALNEVLEKDPDFYTLQDLRKIEPWMLTEVYKILTGLSQGHLFSNMTAQDEYLDEMVFTPLSMLPYLTQLPKETVKHYLRLKNRRPLHRMNTALIAKKRESA